jgi:hypothetical protein
MGCCAGRNGAVMSFATGRPPWDNNEKPLAYPEAYAPRPYSLRGVATALTIALPLIALLELAIARQYLQRVPATAPGEFGIWVGLFFGSSGSGGLDAAYLVLATTIAVIFIVWQYRHAKNAKMLGQTSGLGPRWAIGGWFIPLVNFALPAVQILHSSKASYGGQYRLGALPLGPGIVIWWAVAFGLGNVSFTMAGSRPGYAQSADTLTAFMHVIAASAAVLCVVMVRSLSRRQADALDQLDERHSAGGG